MAQPCTFIIRGRIEKHALSPFALIKNHVLLPFADQLEAADIECKALLTDEVIREIVNLILTNGQVH